MPAPDLRPSLKPSRRLVAALGLVLVLVVAVGATWALRGGGSTPSGAEAPTQTAGAPTQPTSPTPTASVPPAPKALKHTAAPRIEGTVMAGQVVRATMPRHWRPRRVSLTYQWLADGKPIAGATKARLTVPDKVAGAKLAVQVTGTLPGYVTAVERSRGAEVERDDPLIGDRWAVYQGPWNGIYPAYEHASGTNRALLGRIALQPRAIWFAANLSTGRIGNDVRQFIADQQHGDPDALVQMAIFRQWPREESGRGTPLSRAEQADYRAWIDRVADAIGEARVAMILEPDLGLDAVPNNPGDKRTADPAVRLALVRYAAQRFAQLPRTTVYLDASDSDWLSVEKEVPLLTAAGIDDVRGFALGATHYSSVADNIDYGTELARALAAAGHPGKHFVIDTADNGKPFTWQQYYAKHPHGDFDNAEPCRSAAETQCDTLGIPPTTDVTDSRLDLTGLQAARAEKYVDGYLWFGRPWLVRQASPFSLERSLQVARTTPFAG
ncbi:glycoside hydrolase family 6 protein [Nocardioides sp. BP30]|uniref:glycoside hydrolase family 6 protein n=1 Tax=Nocardioides sp. BP30 TaxID=3036374 RepID=UPI002468FAB3|nr:glycoside hydrolase family 6 protein [Nocardioides sp. BP30]WGL50342.1 glycoside hydrolase family 6 protein [Nocardioides sp. BP30]